MIHDDIMMSAEPRDEAVKSRLKVEVSARSINNGLVVDRMTSLYGWNSVRKFGRLRGTYVELRATQSTCSIAFATLIDIKLCDTNLIHSFLIVP